MSGACNCHRSVNAATGHGPANRAGLEKPLPPFASFSVCVPQPTAVADVVLSAIFASVAFHA
jgi:hypothetical protein